MKIYTKRGDKGQTDLICKKEKRVGKNHPIINIVGDIDELQTQIGVLIVNIKTTGAYNLEIDYLRNMQMFLMDISSFISSKAEKNTIEFVHSKIETMEGLIDTITKDLKPLKEFVLAGDNCVEASAHVCRVSCRKLERNLYDLEDVELYEDVLKYVNRLSDYFFTLARLFTSKEMSYKISKKELKTYDM